MSTAANAQDVLIGSGKVYFDRFDTSGKPTGKRMVGNASKLGITPNVTNTTITDYTKRTRTTVAVIPSAQSHKLQVVMKETSPKNLALALNGNVAAFTQTGGTITAEVVASTSVPGLPAPVVDIILQTAQRNISGVTVKALVASTPTTLVAGTDYEIEDAGTGLIRILPGATLPGGVTSITVDYTAAAVLSTAGKTRISGAAVPSITGMFLFVGDPVSGRAQDVEAWKVTLTPSSEINWISDQESDITLDGEILDDSANHSAEPFYRVTER